MNRQRKTCTEANKLQETQKHRKKKIQFKGGSLKRVEKIIYNVFILKIYMITLSEYLHVYCKYLIN